MKYYYLISSLPDLDPDISLKSIDFEEVFDAIDRNLEPEDQKHFHYLLYPHDNRNLLNHLFLEYKDLPFSKFMEPSVLSADAIASYKRARSTFPDYLVTFLQETEPQFANLSMSAMEQRLQSLYSEQLSKEASPFIQQYFSFKQALSAIVAAFNEAQFDFLSPSEFSEKDPLLEALTKGHAVSSKMLKSYPYAEQLKEIIGLQDPVVLERFILKIEWEYLETVPNDFEIEQVLAYGSKLLLLNRKKAQNKESGQLRFKVLSDEIKNMVHSPKTPMV